MKSIKFRHLRRDLSIMMLTLACINIGVEAKIYVDNISYVCQIPSLPTGCELTALEILMRQSGFNITKEELARNIKKSPNPKYIGGVAYAEHPNNSFIGDPFKDKSFGVYSQAIINLMCKYMSRHRIQDLTGSDFSEVEKVVKSGRPVMVWSTLNQAEPKPSITWVTPNDGNFTWKSGEHALVVIGFNDEYVWTSDPAKGVLRKYPKTRFIDIYNKMGKQAISIYKEESNFYKADLKIGDAVMKNEALVGKDNRLWIPIKYLNKLDVNTSTGYVNGEAIIYTKRNGERVTISHKDGKTFKNGEPYDISIIQEDGVTYVNNKWLEQFYNSSILFSLNDDIVYLK